MKSWQVRLALYRPEFFIVCKFCIVVLHLDLQLILFKNEGVSACLGSACCGGPFVKGFNKVPFVKGFNKVFKGFSRVLMSLTRGGVQGESRHT